MIINSIVGGNKCSGAINRILIKPYRQVLRDSNGTVSTDPSIVFSHGSCEISYNNEWTSVTIKTTANQGYQILQNHEFFAVFDDGTEVSLVELLENGNTISMISGISYGGLSTYNWWSLNGDDNYSTAVECYWDIGNLTAEVYNTAGSLEEKKGCFSYISTNALSTSGGYTQVTISAIKINGSQYPLSLPSNYIYAATDAPLYDLSVANPQLASDNSTLSDLKILVTQINGNTSRTYYRVNSGRVITSMVRIGNKSTVSSETTGRPFAQFYPLFLSRTPIAVRHYSSLDSTEVDYITSINYNGEVWYCGNVKASGNDVPTGTVYYTGGIGNVQSCIPSGLIVGLVPIDSGDSVKISAIQNAARRTLDIYYKG